jgi:hypothetical protein
LRYTTEESERNRLREELIAVQKYCKTLEEALEGTDNPDASRE